MPYQRNPDKTAIANRLRLVREQIYGENGGLELADQLGLPFQTWANYESGVTIPGELMLLFLDVTGTNPNWLLRGTGEQYTRRDAK